MTTKKCTTELTQFRKELYQNFNNRADTLMELVDAISSHPNARSVVEYCLAPCFRRSYSALFKAVAEMSWDELTLARLVAPFLPRPRERPFRLLSVDVTPQPRLYAHTLGDRGMVYQPNVVKGNKPVTIGHQYSTVALLPEAEGDASASWVVPLLTRRVRTDEDKELVGAEQVDALLKAGWPAFDDSLCVEVGDTSYSKPAYLHANRHHENLVTIARVRGTRTFHRQCIPGGEENGAGHPTWYGAAFMLKDESTWPDPDDAMTIEERSRRGKVYQVEMKVWHNMLMRGKYKPKRLPMHRYPFTLVQVVRYDERGALAHQRPLWLIVVGERRHELNASASYEAYQQRFDLEHFFRFGKQKLLLTGFQTPEDVREESWWHLVHLAYAQLWMARQVAHSLPRPWERNLPNIKAGRLSPNLVQRDFGRIIRQIGTPAKPPKPRGISPGRRKGTKLTRRPRLKVVVKSKQMAKSSGKH